MHGGLQPKTKQGLRYVASSPEHFQRTLKVGSGRLQRALNWLEYHQSSTVFTAFDFVRDADERVHEASLHYGVVCLYMFCLSSESSAQSQHGIHKLVVLHVGIIVGVAHSMVQNIKRQRFDWQMTKTYMAMPRIHELC